MIADAIGNGMPAALLASNLQATVRTLSTKANTPADVMAGANDSVYGRLEHGRFVSVFYLRLNGEGNILRYVNAGHPAGLLIRANGSVQKLDEGGPVLGEFASPLFLEGEVKLGAGDRLVLYTDGVSEAWSKSGEEFGEAGIVRIAKDSAHLGSEDFSRRLVEEAKRHGGGRLKDDATVIVLSVRGA